MREALNYLLRSNNHSIRFVITTRIPCVDFNSIDVGRRRQINLNEGLDTPYAENVLRELDADGYLGLKNANDQLLDKAREKTKGFPRALELF